MYEPAIRALFGRTAQVDPQQLRERIRKIVYADTQPKWYRTKEVLTLSYYVFEIDYGHCGNYGVAIWAAHLNLLLMYGRAFRELATEMVMGPQISELPLKLTCVWIPIHRKPIELKVRLKLIKCERFDQIRR